MRVWAQFGKLGHSWVISGPLWTHLVLGLGGPNRLRLFMGRVGGPYLDLICEGLVLDPSGVNCGFGLVLEAGVQRQHL